ncbi:xylosyltransferase 1-like [Babylonia areolata]|uniref:xylosyltransferase 1-like n=1 Tax=Babylonia areolata TaxID=304850 RepID=UPI003FD05D6B
MAMANHRLTALSSYWQNEFHHLDTPPINRDTQLTFYHSFMRIAADLLPRHQPDSGLRPLKLLEVNLFLEGDHFHGLLVLFTAEVLSTVREVTLETHVHPKHYYSVLDSKGPMARMQFLEVGSDFDPKELIFRNYGRLLGPYEDLTLRHVWSPGKEFTVSVAWIDPTNVIAVSYDIMIPGTTFVGSHKPSLSRPLRPGVWTVKLMLNMTVVAETQFLVTPITFYQGQPISVSAAQRSHAGPPGLYMGKDFSGLRSYLKVPPSPQLEEEAVANARKVGRDLELWVDSLVPLFWVTKDTCSLEKLELTAVSRCRETLWSSRSPDPKSDINTIGSKLAFGR